MRIAIVSDIHGNRTAFEAVLADLRNTAPDLIFHGGDLADSGSSPVHIVDRIRDLGWRGVVGNTDEMLFQPDSLYRFAAQRPHLKRLFSIVEEIAAATREVLGEERLAWLGSLPRRQTEGSLALVHATPESAWNAPGPESPPGDLESAYRGLGHRVAVYGHIHRPYLREFDGLTVANAGSVSLSYDGDPRASYLLVDEGQPSIRRVAYDVSREQKELVLSGIPHAEWIAKVLATAAFQMP